jgi:acyl carrier protein|tara:strand:- start:695 stop:925 length:231 start_codon:yes stop_codon:yes gene_type:complete
VKKESIIEIFSDILDLEKDIINLESSPEDIDEWDSLANVNIIIALEEELRTKFKLEDLEDIKTLNDFIELANKYSK